MSNYTKPYQTDSLAWQQVLIGVDQLHDAYHSNQINDIEAISICYRTEVEAFLQKSLPGFTAGQQQAYLEMLQKINTNLVNHAKARQCDITAAQKILRHHKNACKGYHNSY